MTLVELLASLILVGIVTAFGAWGFQRYREAVGLDRATAAARGALARARMLGITRRGVVRVRISSSGAITLRDVDGSVASVTPLLTPVFGLDSVRLRPSVLRFNPRGQAAPGSLYLYKGDRGVRIVNNFLGRQRVERFSVP